MEYSPLLSWITAGIEIGIIIAALILHKKKGGTFWVLIGILILLGGYQIFEALNCSPATLGRFARAAFIDITWLPPLGLVYIALMMPRKGYRITAFLYILAAAAFSLWYAFFNQSVMLRHCDTVIALYTSPQPGRALYGIYYQSGVLLLMLLPLFRKGLALSPAEGRSLSLFQLGVLGFMLPSAVTALIFSRLQRAMPSLMCHYALILAICIAILLFLDARDGRDD